MEAELGNALGDGNELCGGCLSSDRSVKPLSALPTLADVYTHLMSYLDENVVNMLICWECRAVLTKIQQFKLKASRAQEWLQWTRTHTDMQVPVLESLSMLNYVHKTTCDLIINDSTEAIFDEVAVKKEADDDPYEETFHDHSDNDVEPNTDLDLRLPDIVAVKTEEQTVKLKTKKRGRLRLKRSKGEKNNVENRTKEKNIRKLEENNKKKEECRNKKEECNKKKKEGRDHRKITIDKERLLEIREKELLKPRYLKAQHKCETCIKVFQCDKTHKKHLIAHHSDRPYCCDICKSTFVSDKALSIHKFSHYRYFQCRHCDYITLNSVTILRHYIDKHKRKKRFQCADCGIKFLRLNELSEHIMTQHRHYECDKCGKKFPTKKRIQKHLAKKYHDTTCPRCGLVLSNHTNLRNHVFVMHRRHEHDANKSDWYCVECDKQFRHHLSYQNHIRGVHNAVKQKYSCSQCHKTFTRSIYLKYHIDCVHLKASQYQCTLCNKSFHRPDGLRTHMAGVHEGVRLPRNKFCDICGRGFQTNKILENHRRTHTGERPYACEHCDAAFAQTTSLKTHVKNVHGAKQKPGCGPPYAVDV